VIWRALLASLLLLLGAPVKAQLQPSQFSNFAFRQHPGAQLPLDAVLRDETGRNVRLGRYFGQKPTLLVLEYLRCPNLCGLVLGNAVAQLKEQKLQPGRDVQFVAISIDPRETAADAASASARYQQDFGADSGARLHFLTGDPEDVRRIANAVGFPYRYDKDLDQYAHPGGFVVATPAGRISRYFLGFGSKATDLRSAISAAGDGEIKPPAYPLLCLCLGYDPQPGTVEAAVLGIVRWLSLAIAAACIVMVALLARRRRAA